MHVSAVMNDGGVRSVGARVADTSYNVDVEDALDATGHGLYNYLILLATCTFHLGTVVDMLGFSLVVPAASCDLHLGLKESGILTSISFAGFIFAQPWGYFADTQGRRKALLISATSGFFFAIVCSVSKDFFMMLAFKFIGCSFSMASLTLTITYLGECTPKHLRRLAYIILPMDFNVPTFFIILRSWRLLIAAMALPLGIGALMMIFLEESPKFLANAGETDKALEVLSRYYRGNKGSDDYPIKSIAGNNNCKDSSSFCDSVIRQSAPIFKPPLLWRTLQLFYLFAICCSTNNVFFMWFPTMVNSFYNSNPDNPESFCHKIIAKITPSIDDTMGPCRNTTPMNTIYSGMLFTSFFTILNIVLIALSSWRKMLLIITIIISGASAVMVNLIDGAIPGMILFTMIQFTGICVGNVGSYFVDMYPTSCRGLATSLGMMVARFTCLAGVNLVGAVVVDHCSLTFYSWAIFILSGVFVAMLLPADRASKQT
ncbi:arabinose-proton symporter isoform X2 [Manduca sexta]|uniref:arabinose-proton symporter isoform X2 n=1 Tax=Manduca sexta TaxID=7130 RepID=UPI0018906A7B|nr:arabinose-proton symporter isoform X2 [Manduca sexta]